MVDYFKMDFLFFYIEFEGDTRRDDPTLIPYSSSHIGAK